MKILNIIPEITVNFGGLVATMVNINQIWLAAGHEVQILTVKKCGLALPVNGRLKEASPSFPARVNNSKEAAEWLAKNYLSFDLVIIHGIWTAINIRSASFLRSKRRSYLVIPHGALDPFDLQKKPLLKNLLGPVLVRKNLAGSTAVLCSTQREADGLVTYGADCRKLVLPWPVSPVHSSITRQEARQALGLREDEFVILSLGRIDYKKGFPVLLPAVKRMLLVNPKTRLLIVGPDSNGYLSVVQKMVKELGLQTVVTFIPTVVGEHKIRVQRAADCFALPSLNENFGYVVVEAMQQGLPCVISDNVYICDVIENGGAGLVCRYDENEVFAGFKKLSTNLELRASMSNAANRVAKTFEPAALQARYLALLNGLARQRGDDVLRVQNCDLTPIS